MFDSESNEFYNIWLPPERFIRWGRIMEFNNEILHFGKTRWNHENIYWHFDLLKDFSWSIHGEINKAITMNCDVGKGIWNVATNIKVNYYFHGENINSQFTLLSWKSFSDNFCVKRERMKKHILIKRHHAMKFSLIHRTFFRSI